MPLLNSIRLGCCGWNSANGGMAIFSHGLGACAVGLAAEVFAGGVADLDFVAGACARTAVERLSRKTATDRKPALIAGLPGALALLRFRSLPMFGSAP